MWSVNIRDVATAAGSGAESSVNEWECVLDWYDWIGASLAPDISAVISCPSMCGSGSHEISYRSGICNG